MWVGIGYQAELTTRASLLEGLMQKESRRSCTSSVIRAAGPIQVILCFGNTHTDIIVDGADWWFVCLSLCQQDISKMCKTLTWARTVS